MGADRCINALNRAREALDTYHSHLDQGQDVALNDWAMEARKRLGQMIWLLSEIDKLSGHEAFETLHAKASALLGSGNVSSSDWDAEMRPEMNHVFERIAAVSEPLETLTEAFYWIAARTRAVIRKLPGTESFEAEAVRNIRNKLLEHPEGSDSGILLTSFAWAAQTGPVLKNARHEDQPAIWMDRGLYVNALEFAEELRRKLDLASALKCEAPPGAC